MLASVVVSVRCVPGAPLHDERRKSVDLAPGHAVGFGDRRSILGATSVLIFSPGVGVGVAIGLGGSAAATAGAARSMMVSSAAARGVKRITASTLNVGFRRVLAANACVSSHVREASR
jgi:hypothetical protein